MQLPLCITLYINKYKDVLHYKHEDPIEAAKKLISSIQQLVGIHNLFGDKKRNCSALSVVAVTIFVGAFIYVGPFSQSVHLIYVISSSKKLESFMAVNCISSTFVPLSTFILMFTSRNRLRTIFEMSKTGLASIPASTLAKAKMMNTLQNARYATWFVIANQVTIHFAYLIMPFLFTIFGSDRYLPTTPGDCYGLSPKYETPNYEITFVLTVLATMFSAINQTGFIVLFVTLLAHELGHFYAITETMNDIYKNLNIDNNIEVTSEDVKATGESLLFCVKHYQFLLKYHEKIQEMFKLIFGVHFLITGIVLVTTLQTLNAWDIRNTLLTGVTGTMPLFIYCFGGEMLIIASVDMSRAVYSCGWQLMDVKQAKTVLLMLCLSQQPLYLTAADIFVMNRETFGDVAQVIYKVYAVFN